MRPPLCHGIFSYIVAGSFYQPFLNSAIPAHPPTQPTPSPPQLSAHLTTEDGAPKGSQEKVSPCFIPFPVPRQWASWPGNPGKAGTAPPFPVEVWESLTDPQSLRQSWVPVASGRLGASCGKAGGGFGPAWWQQHLGTSHFLNPILNQREGQGTSIH